MTPARLLLLVFLGLVVLSSARPAMTQSRAVATTPIIIDASKPIEPPPPLDFRMGGSSPAGHVIGVNSRYLTFDGSPWMPVMAEFHFARYPERYWEEELLKIKAAGIQIVATYVFWIHHEEVEGEFDWSGQRDLRRFVELCGRHGLLVYARIGPWSHGEARNGGFPDWLRAKGPTRRNDPVYLSYVRRYFGQIGEQLKGLLWKDGGPVIGIQLENEYFERGPDAGAAHISELKRNALDSGLDVPLYTVTGWGNPAFPPREVIPVFGAYPDAFWESSLVEQAPSGNYVFDPRRDAGAGPAPSDAGEALSPSYPYFTAEAGGGMQVAYHRRPVIVADDVAAIMLVRLGSGVNLYGYYMFHGGSNPEGKLSTMQESAATDGVYDLPVVSYDFQAPLREFGQLNSSYRVPKLFHLFLNDFGSYLAPMKTASPQNVTAGAEDMTTPRVVARTQGDHAFLFFNNYLRGYGLPEYKGVQISLKLPSETVTFPREPLTIPSGSYFIWPVNLDINGVLLKYASAQLLCEVNDGGQPYYFFFASPGISPELSFDASTIASIKASSGIISRRDGRVYVAGIAPGTGSVVSLRTRNGRLASVVILSKAQAEQAWKINVSGREHLVISTADLFADNARIHLRTRDAGKLKFSMFPAPKKKPVAGVQLRNTGSDGVFTEFAAEIVPRKVALHWERVRQASASTTGRQGKYNAIAPTEDDFNRGGAWRLYWNQDSLNGFNELFLRINYTGDVARLYAGKRLLADDFYKGTDWEVGLKRFAPDISSRGLELKIMPLRKDAQIYVPRKAWPVLPLSGEVAEVSEISASPEYELIIDMKNTGLKK